MRPTTPAEFRMHGLWYGFKSGTTRSLYGEDPAQSFHKYYLKSQDYFIKKDKTEETKLPKKNKEKELSKNPKDNTISNKEFLIINFLKLLRIKVIKK